MLSSLGMLQLPFPILQLPFSILQLPFPSFGCLSPSFTTSLTRSRPPHLVHASVISVVAVSRQEEAEQVTRKLRKLWTKYSEAKGELDGAWGEWAGEKEEMLDSVRMLQQQLLLKDLVIQAFIPPQDVHKVHLTACLLPALLAYCLSCWLLAMHPHDARIYKGEA